MITASQIRGIAGAEYYCSGGAEGTDAASYYVDATEPPGVWSGAGAEALGLTGEVTDHAMREVFGRFRTPDGRWIGTAPRGSGEARERLAEALAAEPDATPERREAIRLAVELSSGTVTGFDFTYSPVKSVSVVWAIAFQAEVTAGAEGDVATAERAREIRTVIEGAVMAGSNAALTYLADHSMTRVGYHGKGITGRWMKAPGLVTAQFLQHTSRNGDPQLHVHGCTLNRVLSEDGQWRAADGADLMRYGPAAGAIGDAVMRSDLARHGFGWEMRDGVWEVALADPALCRRWSSRDTEIDDRIAELVTVAQERNGGRKLTPVEMTRIRQTATLGTRRAKAEAEDAQERGARFRGEVAEIGLDPALQYLDLDVTAGSAPVEPGVFSVEAVVSEAVATCGEEYSTFRAPDLTREVMGRLPAVLGLDGDGTRELAERLTAEARSHPDVAQVAGRRGPDPESDPYGRPSADRFAARFTLEAEEALRRLAVVRGAHWVEAAEVGAWLDEHAPTIGADQRAAVEGSPPDAVMNARIPAGTGRVRHGCPVRAWSPGRGPGPATPGRDERPAG